MNSDKTLITVTGPSLTGKSTLEALLKEHGCVPVVSTTTRAMREGEVDGVHYNFVNKEEFKNRLASGGFIEHVEVDGNFYGVGKQEAIKAFVEGKPVCIVCEPHGAKQVYNFAQQNGWNAVRVFLNNPQQVLFERLFDRFRDDKKGTSARYASRLTNMVEFEGDNWIKPALTGKDPYELVFKEFGSQNQSEVISQVMKRALGDDWVPKKKPVNKI